MWDHFGTATEKGVPDYHFQNYRLYVSCYRQSNKSNKVNNQNYRQIKVTDLYYSAIFVTWFVIFNQYLICNM